MVETRIKLEDDFMGIVIKMSDSNPGAMQALFELAKTSPIADPDSAMGPYGPMLSLDMCGIYGSDIYILWSDICKKNTVKTLAVIRANQLGFLNSDVLREACRRQDRSGSKMIDVEAFYGAVREMLPNFDNTNSSR